MTFSRSHIGMMGIISLFTGMIAPVFWLWEREYPFPLTSIQTISYVILFLLALCFYLVSIHRWQIVKIIDVVIIILLSYISIQYLTDSIYAGNTANPLDSVRWWIVFIIIGIVFLSYSIWTKGVDTKSDANILSDTIIWIVWTLTLLWLSALIIAGSIWTKFPTQTDSVLEKIYWSGSIQSVSWVTMTVAHDNISSLVFERKNDLLSYMIASETGWTLYPEWVFYSWQNISYTRIGEKTLIKSDTGFSLDNIELPREAVMGDWVLKIQTENGVRFVTKNLDISYTGITQWIWIFWASEDGTSIAWVEEATSWVILKKDNETIGNTYQNITDISLSKNGRSLMAIGVTNSWEKLILKNGVPVETIRDTYRAWTWKSNWIHSIYVVDSSWSLSVIYNWVSTGQDFDEVRDVFLEKSGNSYAFFGRKKWENTYCFITRFKGSVCWIEWYMNPWVGADGSTIIYAGLREGTWSLYRNTATVIRDTHYTRRDISWDYLFYDKTNPREYLFVEKIWEEQYQFRKNGELIPGTWKDVGLNVGFWYDGKVILSARDNQGWRIIEL